MNVALQSSPIPLGLLYLNEGAVRYDEFTQRGTIISEEEKLATLEAEFDKSAIV